VQIQQLEDELGVQLFVRSKRGVEITRPGEVFLVEAREVLSRLDRSASVTKKADRDDAGTLRLGFVATALFSLLPALLEAIKVQLPLVVVELVECPSGAQIQAIQAGTMDLGLGYLEELPHQVSSATVLLEQFVIVLPAMHKAAKKKMVSFDDFRDDLLMIPRKDLFPSKYQLIIDLLVAAGVTDMRMQEIDHPLTALALAAANAGFAFVPASALHLTPKGVVLRPLAMDVPAFKTVALWSNQSPDPLVQRVLGILRTIKKGSKVSSANLAASKA
jgi:DNA-binding transcriptional LysR family regulator